MYLSHLTWHIKNKPLNPMSPLRNIQISLCHPHLFNYHHSSAQLLKPDNSMLPLTPPTPQPARWQHAAPDSFHPSTCTSKQATALVGATSKLCLSCLCTNHCHCLCPNHYFLYCISSLLNGLSFSTLAATPSILKQYQGFKNANKIMALYFTQNYFQFLQWIAKLSKIQLPP